MQQQSRNNGVFVAWSSEQTLDRTLHPTQSTTKLVCSRAVDLALAKLWLRRNLFENCSQITSHPTTSVRPPDSSSFMPVEADLSTQCSSAQADFGTGGLCPAHLIFYNQGTCAQRVPHGQRRPGIRDQVMVEHVDAPRDGMHASVDSWVRPADGAPPVTWFRLVPGEDGPSCWAAEYTKANGGPGIFVFHTF